MNLRKISSLVSAAFLALFLTVQLSPTVALAQDAVPVVAPASAPAPAPVPVVEEVIEAEAAPLADSVPIDQTSIAKIVNELMNALIPVFVMIIGGLGTLLLNKVRQKFNLKVSDEQIQSWSMIAEKAAHRGGEWARKKANAAADGKAMPGPEIMEVAANWAVDLGKQFKLPQMGREKLEALIEAELFKLRGDSSNTNHIA